MTDNLRGILAMLASAAGFVTNDAIVKVVTTELPTGEIIFIRGALATALMGIVTSMMGGWRSPSVLFRPAMMLRLLAAVTATLFVVASLRHLPLSTTNGVLQASPLLVTAGAALLLGAHVGPHRWAASLLGLFGVLLIVKPGTESFVPEAWLALACLVAASVRDLTTRFIDHSVPSIFVTFASSAVIMLAGLALLPLEVWVWPSARALTLLSVAAVCLFVAYHFGVVAMRIGEIPVVAPFRYTAMVLALILGFVVWGHVPDWLSLAGMALVVAAGLYLLVHERKGLRMRAAAVAPAATPVEQLRKS